MGGRQNVQSALSQQFNELFRGLHKRNPELAQRTKDVLRRLNSLANGSTAKVGVQTVSGGDRDYSPKPVDSPFHHWLTIFLSARNDDVLLEQVMEAEEECDRAQGKEHEEVAVRSSFHASATYGESGADREDQEAQWVLSRYQGLTARQAALREGDPRLEDWIEKVRRLNGYDDQGNPRRNWDRWTEDEKREQVRQLRRRDKTISVRKVAEHFEVSHTLIFRDYWGDATNPNKAA